MKDLNNKLKDLKIDNIKAPDELEVMLRSALDGDSKDEKPKIKFYNTKLLKIVACFAVVLLIFNFDTVSAAFKKLVGYEDYFSYNRYIKGLNKEGKLQIVDEDVVFSDEDVVTIEAILYDGEFINIFTKQKSDGSGYKNDIKVKGGQMSSLSYEEIDGYDYAVYKNNAGKDLKKITLEVIREEEIEEITIDIDKDKILKSIVLENEAKTMEVDGVTVEINEVKLSPLALTVDYNVISIDENKTKLIKQNGTNIIDEGISLSIGVEGKNLDVVGAVRYDDKIEIENGLRLRQYFYTNDIRINKVKNLKVILYGVYESENLGFEFKESLKNYWVNDDLFIEHAYNNDGRYGIKYWSRILNDDIDCPKYWICPYESFYMETASKEHKKELLGKDYKDFVYLHSSLNEEDINRLFKAENKIYKASEKEREIEYKVNYKD